MQNALGHTQQFWTMNGSYQMERVKATLRGSRDEVMIYVDDAIWDDKINQQDVADLQLRLHDRTPEGSIDPGAGIVALERKLFEKDRSPVTLLLTDNNAPFEGFFTPMDLLPEEEAVKYGGHSNERPMVHLNTGRIKEGTSPSEHLGPIFSHEVQHLFHYQHDPDEETWLRELLAQGAMNLTGHRDVEMELLSKQPPAAPILTGDEEMANYPGLTRFAAHLQKRFGEDIMIRLNRHPENGVDSVDAVLREMGTGENFDSVLRDHFVELASKQLAAELPLERYRVGDAGGVLSAQVKPGGAEFIHLSQTAPLTLQVDGWRDGLFLEKLVLENGRLCREPLVPESGSIELSPHSRQFLMLGSSGPAGSLKLAFSPAV
jgi:hypothetical protein